MKKLLFIRSVPISQFYQLFMHLLKLVTDQKEFRNPLKPQKNKNAARCISFQIKYRLRRHYDTFKVFKIAKKYF